MCEHAALPALAQSIFFCGAIVGGLMFGLIADRYGRIPALVGTNLLGFVGGVLSAFSYNFTSFAFFRFVLGFAFDNCFTMMYILGKLNIYYQFACTLSKHENKLLFNIFSCDNYCDYNFIIIAIKLN